MEKRKLVEELHTPARRLYPRRHTILRGLSDLFQVDLVEMIPYHRENKNFKYILTCINCFSKFAYCLPLKSKSSEEVAKQMNLILKKLPKSKIPKLLQSDNGTEFMGKPFQILMKKYKIKHYTTFSNIKAAIVERFNRTLKSKMWIEFGVQGNHQWVKLLPLLVDSYNDTKHRSIGMRPKEVKKSNESTVFLRLNKPKIITHAKPKYNLGDLVRISKQKQVFDKGYLPNWSNELFKITKVGKTTPRVYNISDLKDNPILGTFYEQELLATKYPDIYLIERVLKKRKNKVLVKYLGFKSDENQWIPIHDLK